MGAHEVEGPAFKSPAEPVLGSIGLSGAWCPIQARCWLEWEIAGPTACPELVEGCHKRYRREAPHLTAVGLSTGEAEATTRQLIASPCTDLASGDVLKLNSMRALACWQQLMCVGLDFRRFR